MIWLPVCVLCYVYLSEYVWSDTCFHHTYVPLGQKHMASVFEVIFVVLLWRCIQSKFLDIDRTTLRWRVPRSQRRSHIASIFSEWFRSSWFIVWVKINLVMSPLPSGKSSRCAYIFHKEQTSNGERFESENTSPWLSHFSDLCVCVSVCVHWMVGK